MNFIIHFQAAFTWRTTPFKNIIKMASEMNDFQKITCGVATISENISGKSRDSWDIIHGPVVVGCSYCALLALFNFSFILYRFVLFVCLYDETFKIKK